MTFDPGLPAGNGSAAILRALGALMAALGGEAGAVPQAPAFAASRAPSAPAYEPPARPEAPRAQPPGGDVAAEAEFILTDARTRAERLLHDSMSRAQDLLARDRGVPSAPAGGTTAADLEPVRRSVDDLARAMRDVQARLDRIEALLASQRAAATQPPAVTPRPAPAAEEDRRPGVLSVVSPQPRPAASAPPAPAAPPPPVPPAAAPAAQAAPSAPSASPSVPSAVPPSAVPPMRGGAQPAAAQARDLAEAEAEPMPTPTPTTEPAAASAPAEPPAAPAAWPRGERAREAEVGGTLATFTPSDGSVLLRAAPVSGFQGLMRLQDALQRIAAVRQATVEAYSQGEARLRLELASDVESDEIAEGLASSLGQSATVREASEVERTIVIALG